MLSEEEEKAANAAYDSAKEATWAAIHAAVKEATWAAIHAAVEAVPAMREKSQAGTQMFTDKTDEYDMREKPQSYVPVQPQAGTYALEQIEKAIRGAGVGETIANEICRCLLSPPEDEHMTEEVMKILGRAETNGDSFAVTADRLINYLRQELADEQKAGK